MKILVIHGPNLQLLGAREPHIYGATTLDDINRQVTERATRAGMTAECAQYNHEGDVVTAIGGARAKGFAGIVINPAAYTHTSVAILDAIRACGVPVIEVHLSNISAREEYRKRSITAEGAVGSIAGFGVNSYLLAVDAMAGIIKK